MLYRTQVVFVTAVLVLQPAAGFAQTEPAQRTATRTTEDSGRNSGRLIMLGAITLAVLINVLLATADGDDEPASP